MFSNVVGLNPANPIIVWASETSDICLLIGDTDKKIRFCVCDHGSDQVLGPI